MPRAWKSMVAWLDEMYKNPMLEEVEVIVPEEFEGVEPPPMLGWKDPPEEGNGVGVEAGIGGEVVNG